jgi:hypothetical protein
MVIQMISSAGTIYGSCATPADLVRRQSKGMGTAADIAAVTAALNEHGECCVRSTRTFAHGIAAGRAVATYRGRIERVI